MAFTYDGSKYVRHLNLRRNSIDVIAMTLTCISKISKYFLNLSKHLDASAFTLIFPYIRFMRLNSVNLIITEFLRKNTHENDMKEHFNNKKKYIYKTKKKTHRIQNINQVGTNTWICFRLGNLHMTHGSTKNICDHTNRPIIFKYKQSKANKKNNNMS